MKIQKLIRSIPCLSLQKTVVFLAGMLTVAVSYAQNTFTATISLSTISPITSFYKNYHDSAKLFYGGLGGTDFFNRKENIGICEAERSDGGPWKPVTGQKQTLCGRMPLNRIATLARENSDGDVDIYLRPNPSFNWLMTRSERPAGSSFERGSVGGEIAFKEPGNQPGNDGAIYIKNIPASLLENRDMCIYGAWVSDLGHERQPEIHPVQQMWFTEQRAGSTVYHLFSMFDNSKRFNDGNDFNAGCTKSWIHAPLENTFYLPFELSVPSSVIHRPGIVDSTITYDIEIVSSHKMNGYDPGHSSLNIVYKGLTIIRVNSANQSSPYVWLECIYTDGNKLKGFLKIKTSVSEPYLSPAAATGGHAFLKVTQKKKSTSPAILETERIN